ncbi:MAG: hypothetical protein ACXVBW_16065, partial [Bdellovibrionota bacterium]
MARKTASTKRLSAKPWTGLWTTFQERAQAFASKLPVIKPGVALIALAMAAFTLSVAGAGIALTWRVMRIENRAYVAQSISDTASILAAHVRDQVEHVSDDLLEIGHSQLKPVLVKLELDRKLSPEEDRRMMEHTPTGTLVGTLEVDPEILDISIWRRGSVQSRVPVRAYLATNSRYLYSAPEILQKLLGMESAEAQVVGSVFQGAAVMRSEQIPDAGKMAFLAIPLGKGFVSEVIVAHLRLDRFQKAFRRDGKIWLSLVDSSGDVLAHPDSRAINDHLSLAATPIFQLLKGSSLMIGQTEFMNSRGERYFGGYSRIGFGDLAVLASISEADATSGLEVVRTQTWIYLTLLFLACTVGCYFFFGRKKFKLPNADWMRRWIGTGWSEPLAHAPDREPLLGVKSRALPPEFRTVTVLHGTLRQVTTLLEKSQP